MLVAKIKWIHEKIAKKSIPVANVCTIVTTTRSKKREKKSGNFFFLKKIHNFNLKFQQIKINYPQIFFKFFSYYLSLEKVFKKIEKLRNSSQKKKLTHPVLTVFKSACDREIE